MYEVNGLRFRSVDALVSYLKEHKDQWVNVRYVESYFLNDPMEQ